MTDTIVPPPSEFVQFWNEILVPKFVKYKHVLVGGLGQHSAAIFPKLEVNAGETVMDAGAGFGDTAIMLAQRVGPSGHVTAIECEYTQTVDGKLHGTGETFTLAADQVFKAIGQTFVPEPAAGAGINITGGRIEVDADRRTSLDDVWAGGDCITGGEDLTVTAVEDGKVAAEAIHRRLTG